MKKQCLSYGLFRRARLSLFAGLIVMMTLFGCQKHLDPETVSVKTSTKDGPGNTDFNWETATSMPCSSSTPVNLVPSMPWMTQSGSYIDPAIVNDYKSQDGWVLVYNTFNSNTLPYPPLPAGGLYFALYNKYRGLLRFYLYIPQGFTSNSLNIQHGLSVYSTGGQSTNMLNFEGSDMVDAAANNLNFTKTNNVAVAYGGGWYAMQYEIAYDPNFASTSNLGLAWNNRTVNISTIQIGGTSTGTITGSITQQSSGTDPANILINGLLTAAEIYSTAGGPGLSGLSDAANNGLAGSITGFLSAIFGGNSNNPLEVDLKMNQTISLSGTITNPGQPLFPNTFIVPGQTSTQNVAPSQGGALYSSLLGVFNLAHRPTIISVIAQDNRLSDPRRGWWSGNVHRTYSIDPNSIALQVNPAANATVSIVHEDLLLFNPNSGPYYYTVSGGTSETIGNITSVVNPTYVQHGVVNRNNGAVSAYQSAMVRLVLSVTPSSGGVSSKIVKTFLANIQYQ
ncbi:MAG: hypothetical protein J0H74_29915 [Chitinophagaceae bacterium]|nr:hypothetical protein [Chitinophagaceae bacterium]